MGETNGDPLLKVASKSSGDSLEIKEEKLSAPSDHDLKGKLTLQLALAVFACAVGSSFQFGFQVGVLNTPQQLLVKEYEYGFESGITNSTRQLTEDKALVLWACTVAIFGAGGLVAGVSGSYLANRFGRKKAMLYNNILLFLAVGCMISAKFVKQLEFMIVGRLLHGINSGFSTIVAPLYLTEISPVNLRGGVGMIHQLALALGILISQVLGLRQVFGTIDLYYLLFGAPLIPAFLQLITLPFCAESPSWLYITRDMAGLSKSALQTFNGAFNVNNQLKVYEIEYRELHKRSQVKMSFSDMFRKSYLREPLIIAIVMQLSMQWSGIIAILNYSTSIFRSAGLSTTDSQFATLGISGVKVAMTFVAIMLMDRLGRRPLHIIGLSGCLVSMVLITIALCIQHLYDWAKYISILSLILFIMSFATGPGGIPWFIAAELFDQTARSYAISIAITINWIAHSISGLLFPIMQKGMGEYCFLPFAVLLVLFVAFTFWKLPETKNRTIDEIVSTFKTLDNRDDSGVKLTVMYNHERTNA